MTRRLELRENDLLIPLLIISQPSDSKGWHAVTLFSDAILIISLALRPIEYRLFEEPKVSREGINLPRRFD